MFVYCCRERILVIFPGQYTEKWTASIKSILSGSPREQLVAYGVLATSSYYCSVSKTAALPVAATCYFILILQTWMSESLSPFSFHSVPQLSPELSGWQQSRRFSDCRNSSTLLLILLLLSYIWRGLKMNLLCNMTGDCQVPK